MAGGFYTAVEGADFLPDTFNEYVRDQTLSRFTSSGARSAAITAPTSGQPSYLATAGSTEGPEFYTTGGDWLPPWNLPWGIIGQANVTTSQNISTTSQTAVTSATVTFTAVANRRYRITGKARPQSNTASAAVISLYVVKDGSILDLIGYTNDTVSSGSYKMTGSTTDSPTAGSHTYRLDLQFSVNGGTGNANNASSTDITSILVEDIGPAGAPA